MKKLTDRQNEVLSFISDYIKTHSFSPAVREVADHFEISVKGAHDHITALRRKGYLKQADKRPRTMGLANQSNDDDTLVTIPVLGTIAAGLPLMAQENFDGNVKLPVSMLKKNKEYFALKVKGDSMIGAGILEGDTAIIEEQNSAGNGEIVVALLDDSTTLKRFYRESTRIKLQAENPAIQPIYSQDVKILGRLSSIIRSY